MRLNAQARTSTGADTWACTSRTLMPLYMAVSLADVSACGPQTLRSTPVAVPRGVPHRGTGARGGEGAGRLGCPSRAAVRRPDDPRDGRPRVHRPAQRTRVDRPRR